MGLFSKLPHMETNGSGQAVVQIEGFGGKTRPVRVSEVSENGGKAWILQPQIDSQTNLKPSYGEKVTILRTPSGHATKTRHGITITNKIAFQDQQTYGIEKLEEASLNGKRTQAIVYATGTGKSFVLIAPAIANGKGVFVVSNEAQVLQLKKDIALLDADIKDDDMITSVAIQKGKESQALASHKYTVITNADLARFAPHLERSLISIDEVHEVNPSTLRELSAPGKGNTLQVVTATWTPELQEIFGDPLAEINMHFAANKLKAFRPIHTNVQQFTAQQDADERVFNMMADYYGGITYNKNPNAGAMGNPNPLTLDYLKTDEGRKLPLDSAIRRIRESNEVRRFDHMNMAFTKNKKLLENLADSYQGVFDGNYRQMDALAKKVSEMRAGGRIAEEMRLSDHLVGRETASVDLSDPAIRERFKGVIASSTIDAKGLQREAQDALKEQVADVITRKVVGLFSDNTPANVVRSEEKAGKLDEQLKLYSLGELGKLDKYERGFIEAIKKEGPNSVYENIASQLSGVRNRDEILAAVKKGDFTKLRIDKNAIDLSAFGEARYATSVSQSAALDGEGGVAKTAERINKGYHTHIIGDSELATGYSNPDIMSVQRVIENNIEDSVIRGTQMLGRAIRAKDGIAFASEYLGDNLTKDGVLGNTNGRPFLFEDVMAENYMDRAQTYMANYSREHPKTRPATPPETAVVASTSPVNEPARTQGHGQKGLT